MVPDLAPLVHELVAWKAVGDAVPVTRMTFGVDGDHVSLKPPAELGLTPCELKNERPGPQAEMSIPGGGKNEMLSARFRGGVTDESSSELSPPPFAATPTA